MHGVCLPPPPAPPAAGITRGLSKGAVPEHFGAHDDDGHHGFRVRALWRTTLHLERGLCFSLV